MGKKGRGDGGLSRQTPDSVLFHVQITQQHIGSFKLIIDSGTETFFGTGFKDETFGADSDCSSPGKTAFSRIS